MKAILKYNSGEVKELDLPSTIVDYDQAPGIIVHEDYGFWCFSPARRGTAVVYIQCETLFIPPNGPSIHES